ncbi:MAG TPA: pyridoxal phosphate-dependent aminotransferase [Alphaproteobacteria bacterium]|nr:pyridoxal phosphate-dependent aminotransferase [Alphaproteobacteria bacterium]
MPTDTLRFSAAMRLVGESEIAQVWKLGFEVPDVVGLWVGEGDLPTPDFISDAAVKALRDGHTFYTHKSGIPELRAALRRYHARIYGVEPAIERITVTGSAMTGILMLMQALLDPGDSVAVVTPVWPNIFAAVQIQGGIVREVPLKVEGDRWRLDLEALFAACDRTTKAIFIVSPGNPTGWIMTAEEQAAVVDFCRQRSILYIADEVYHRFVYEGRGVAPSVLEVMRPDDPVSIVNTFSKSWAMTGWRLGWLISPPRLAETLDTLVEYNTSGSQPFLQHACIVALEKGDGFIAEQVERCGRARALLMQRFAAMPRIRLMRPDAAFYAFFGIEGVSDSLSHAKKLVREARVGLAPGTAFGKSGQGWFRLCYAGSIDRLQRGFDRLEAAL